MRPRQALEADVELGGVSAGLEADPPPQTAQMNATAEIKNARASVRVTWDAPSRECEASVGCTKALEPQAYIARPKKASGGTVEDKHCLMETLPASPKVQQM